MVHLEDDVLGLELARGGRAPWPDGGSVQGDGEAPDRAAVEVHHP